MKKLIGTGLLALATTVLAQEKPAMPPAPPEVQKTVDAFAGKWTFDAKLTAAGMPAPAPVKLSMDCQKTALGTAVLCSGKGEATGLGPMEMGLVAGYDPEEKLVRFMIITSGGEFHDHKGVWKDKDLVFEPLKYTTGGQAMTEDFSFTVVSDKSMSFKSVVTKADGSKETFEGTGTR
jgi:uncharacterized protein DUF1579